MPKTSCLILAFSAIAVFFLPYDTFAKKLTVDADGQATYPTIVAALNASSFNDTIYIQGSDIDIYDEVWPNDRSPDLTIMSAFSNPDSFPVVRFSGVNWATFWQNGGIATTRFKQIVLNDCPSISLTNNQRNCIIDRCIIKNFTNTVFIMSGDHQTTYLYITNTIFWNNNTTIFSKPSLHNVNGPYAKVTNCTFYGNQTINAEDNVSTTDVLNQKIVVIKNSIFKNNSTIVIDNDIKSAYTYNLLPSGQSGWGTGSVYNDNPGFINGTPSKASDFGLTSSSPAMDKATNTDAPAYDITGGSRSGTYDIGAFEYGNGGSGSGNILYWDNSTSAGYQISNGTWGSNNYWSADGTNLVAWAGAGYSAVFAGIDGNWTITVNGTQNVDSMAFLNNGYTISGGTSLNFGSKSGIYVASGKEATINTVISGSPGVSKYGSGTLILGGSNTYSGNTTIHAGTLVANHNSALGNTTGTTTLNGGTTPVVLQLGNVTITGETITLKSDSLTKAISQIHLPSGRTATLNGTVNYSGNYYNKIISDGTLNVQGAISGSGGLWSFLYLDGSGNGTLNSTVSIGIVHLLKDGGGTWTINSTGNTWNATCINNGTLRNGASNCLPAATVLVMGANDANNVTYNLNGYSQTVGGIADGGTTGGTKQITNTGSAATLTVNNSTAYTYSYLISGSISLVKSGSEKFTLAGANTYTGNTTVSAGDLCINGSLASASAVSVASGATLSGTGSVPGNVTISNGGKIAPGYGNTGTLSTGNLTLNSSSALNFELGSSSDKIVVSGNLTLDGTLNISGAFGFGAGTYTLLTYSGSVTNNTLSLGSVPSGFDYSISVSGGNVNVTVVDNNPGNVVTVDADGPASYSSLDAVLVAIEAGSIDPDTVKFIGSNQHTYSWNTPVDKSLGYIVFKGAETDPDKFPIINHSGSADGYNLFNKTDAHFQRVILTGSKGFNLAQNAHSFSFRQCVMRDFSGTYAFHLEGNTGGTVIFENCLFEGNTCTNIFDLNYWGGSPIFTITNCTFDNNTSIWDEDEDNSTNFSLKNCIFSGNGTTFRGNLLRGKTSYSLTSEGLSGYGTGCVSNGTPQYVSGSRNNPSDWKLKNGTPADGIGTTSGAPGVDLGGFSRSGGNDAGCWNYDAIVNYYWDVSTSAGYQAGNGTWGTNNYWTSDGTTLVAWPGAGKSATFIGSDGTWTITVNGTQNVDSLAFVKNGYTLTDGTSLNFSTKSGIFVDAEKTGTIETKITGTPGLSKYGSGTLVLGGSSTFTGPTVINEGVVSTSYLNNGGNSSNIGSSSNSAANLVFNGGTLRYTGVNQDCDRLFTISTSGGTIDGSGIGYLRFTNNGTVGFSGTGARVLTLTGSCYGNVLSTVLTDYSGSSTFLIKSGSGSWILTGNNTATGLVTINAGTLQIGNAGTSGAINGSVVNDGILVFNRSNSCTFSKVISGSGNLIQAGIGTLVLSGANTYSGTTTINSGTLQLGAANIIPDGAGKGDVVVNGTLDLNSYSETINGLNGNGTVNNSASGSPVLTIGANNANSNFSGVIKNTAGTLGITKTGLGLINLAGNNTYSGVTTISAGELRINGSTSTASAVTVQSGGKISGNGTIGGSVTINNGGIIDPGSNSSGTLTTGSLNLNSSSILNFDLGTSSDRINVNGNLILDGVLYITNAGGFDVGDYTLMTYTGTITNNTLSIGILPLSSYSYSIEAGAGKVILHVISKEELLPLTVVQSEPSCSVYTSKWTLVFDNNNGGGIKALTDSIHGLHHGQGNQIGGSQNLYFVEYNGTSSKQNGNWSVKHVGSFRTTIHQSGSLAAGIDYTNEYTVHGSGRIYIKSTVFNSGSSVSAKTIRFACERNPVATMAVLTGNASADQAPYVLLSSNASQQNDILLSIKDLWSASPGVPNSATGFYNNASTGYAGYECNNFSLPSGQRQSWELMIDFNHQSWNDTNGVGKYVDDYRKPDSLVYIAGTPAMERDWEQHLYGHWKFDETGAVDTARDASGNNRYGIISGGSWKDGRLAGGIQLNGSQNVTVQNDADFNPYKRFTVMAWIKPSVAISAGSTIIGKHNGTQGWKFTGDGSGRLALTLDGTTMSATSPTGTGEWCHAAVSCNSSGQVIFYVNGNADKVFSGSYTVTNNSANVIIGSGFSGIIDDVRYYGDTITENTLKSIYRNGIRSSEGVYDTRANNDNTLHVLIDGDDIPRRFPVFRIANYWASTKPAPGCVKLNGTVLTEGTDYFADLMDVWNVLYIGINKTVLSNSVRLFIDDASSKGSVNRTTPKMVSGKNTIGSVDYIWVKNFQENGFGPDSSRQWYVNWKMSENYGKDGDPWFMASSVTNPYYQIDTSFMTNLIPGYDGYNESWGSYCFQIGSYFPKTSDHVFTPFTYAVEESSSVRVVLRINERTANSFGSYFNIITRWTIYPTGQFYKWDSLYSFSGEPSQVYIGASMDDTTYSSFYTNKIKKRGGVIYSGKYQDFVHAWLSMKNSSGFQDQPFNSDTILTWREGNRVGLDFGDMSTTSAWNSSHIQTVVYLDIQKPDMNSSFVDSVANSAQYPQTPVMITGSLLSEANATEGDLNGDGFNEREGAYVIKSNNNEVHLRLPAHGDTCRFKPVLRITGYTAMSKPQYVIIYRGNDTIALVEGQYYNAFLNKSKKELVIQIDSVFCDTTSIFISNDRTLAVSLSSFSAAPGDRCDTLRWRTESEQENLGFYLCRRIKPEFMDSLIDVLQKKGEGSVETSLLFKNKIINLQDTGWVRVNNQLIAGANSGVSMGPRDYMYIDYNVQNEILYEYKLIALDYSNKEKIYGPVQVMPRRLLPVKFALFRNFPNPFRNATIIRFALAQDSRISLNIYNLQGQLVKRLIKPDMVFRTGVHQVIWDGKSESGGALAAGPYVYRLVAGRFADANVLLLSK